MYKMTFSVVLTSDNTTEKKEFSSWEEALQGARDICEQISQETGEKGLSLIRPTNISNGHFMPV